MKLEYGDPNKVEEIVELVREEVSELLNTPNEEVAHLAQTFIELSGLWYFTEW